MCVEVDLSLGLTKASRRSLRSQLPRTDRLRPTQRTGEANCTACHGIRGERGTAVLPHGHSSTIFRISDTLTVRTNQADAFVFDFMLRSIPRREAGHLHFGYGAAKMR